MLVYFRYHFVMYGVSKQVTSMTQSTQQIRIAILEHCGHQHETIQLLVTAAKEQHHLDGTGTVAKGNCTVAMLG